MSENLSKAVVDAARDFLYGCGGTGPLRHALNAYDTAALDEAGMPMLAAGAVRADGLPPLTGILQARVPLGAIENGRAYADRLEQSALTCEAGDLRMSSDWQEFRRCFERLAELATHNVSLTGAQASEPAGRDWRVALVVSSSDPSKHVRWLADGAAEIARVEQHRSFIRWLDTPQPSAEVVRDAALLEGIAERAGGKLTEQERGHIMDVARNIRDVANFCMFLWALGERIGVAQASEPAVLEDIEQQRGR